MSSEPHRPLPRQSLQTAEIKPNWPLESREVSSLGQGGGNRLFFFLLNSRFKRDHNLLWSAIPSTWIVGIFHSFILFSLFLRSKNL